MYESNKLWFSEKKNHAHRNTKSILINFDQFWSKQMFWSNLIKIDQIWSKLIKFDQNEKSQSTGHKQVFTHKKTKN